MKSRKSGFTFVEMIGALFICSLLFVFFVPNLVKQYSNLRDAEKSLEMKEILYEELVNHSSEKNFSVSREGYTIIVSEKEVRIKDEKTSEEVHYS